MRIFKNQRGDTIMEVLICTAIIGLLMTASFALTNRSSAANQKSQERSYANQVAESQIELLKAYAEKNTLPTNHYFCMRQYQPANGADNTPGNNAKLTGAVAVILPASFTPANTPDGDVANLGTDATGTARYTRDCYKDNRYSVTFWSPQVSGNIRGNGATGVYNVPFGLTVRWDGLNGGIEELKTFYSLYNADGTGFSDGAEAARAVCNNGRGDDAEGPLGRDDGRVDALDPGCQFADGSHNTLGTSENNPACSNYGYNDDSDVYGADFPNDPGCTSARDNNEADNPACSNGQDDDDDGKIDANGQLNNGANKDPGCSNNLRDGNEGDYDLPINGSDLICTADLIVAPCEKPGTSLWSLHNYLAERKLETAPSGTYSITVNYGQVQGHPFFPPPPTGTYNYQIGVYVNDVRVSTQYLPATDTTFTFNITSSTTNPKIGMYWENNAFIYPPSGGIYDPNWLINSWRVRYTE